MITEFFLFAAGWLTGVITLIVVVCCVASGDYDRAEEKWSEKDENAKT